MVLITILDNITETSMPFNEFVLYRYNHYRDEKQVLIVCCGVEQCSSIVIPDGLKVIFVGRKIRNIRKAISSVIKECKREKLEYAIHLHQVQSAFLAEIAMFGTGFRKKTLFTVHSTFSGYKFHNRLLSFLNCMFAKRVTCVSKASYCDYPKIIRRRKKERMIPIQNGVDIERVQNVVSSYSRNKTDEFFDCVYVARIIPIKNHKFLMEVIKKLDKRIRFIFVGAEDKNREIRTIAENEGLIDRVLFTGLIPRDSVFQELLNCDLYISSSTLEGLPVSVLEAMCCSLPCVLSDIPQHLEIGNVGESLRYFEFDENKWAEAINNFAKMDKRIREELGNNAKEYVEKNFSLERMHREYDLIYRELC